MPWKVDGNKQFVGDENGNPIWVTDAGDENSVDYSAMHKALSEAKKEAAQRRDKIKTLETQFESFNGIEDLKAFRKQAEDDRAAVSSMADKDKDVEDRIKAQVDAATKPYRETVDRLTTEKAAADARLQKETIANAFARSTFITDKVHPKARAAMTDIFQKHFSINAEGRLVATGPDGNTLYSENGPANFEESINLLMESYPGKEIFLVGSSSDGGGASKDLNKSANKGAPASFIDCKTPAEERAFLESLKA